MTGPVTVADLGYLQIRAVMEDHEEHGKRYHRYHVVIESSKQAHFQDAFAPENETVEEFSQRVAALIRSHPHLVI